MKRRTRVALVLEDDGADSGATGKRPQHRSGVNALAATQAAGPAGVRLYTGSRDATVRAWDVPRPASATTTVTASAACFEGHSDWVNDVVLVDRDRFRTLRRPTRPAGGPALRARLNPCTRPRRCVRLVATSDLGLVRHDAQGLGRDVGGVPPHGHAALRLRQGARVRARQEPPGVGGP